MATAVVASLLISATTASAAAPTVHVTRYSPTVSGNIGAPTAGVKATVSLVRDGTTIEAAPAATTNASGEWTAKFAAHAPSDALDVVDVKYSGTGGPAEASYGDASPSGTKAALGFFDQGVSIAAGGETGGALCNNFAGVKCAALTAHISYSGGGSAEVVGKPDEANEEIEELAFSPAVAANDTVTVTGSFTEEDGSTFELTVPATLPGVGNVFAGNGSDAPVCSADLVTLAVSCGPVAAGSYSLVQTRGATNLGSTSATVTAGGEIASFQLSSLQSADDLALSVAGAGGRLLSTDHVLTLSVEELETLSFGVSSITVTGGHCQPDAWFGASGGGGICSANGAAPANSATALEDELSGGATTVTPALVSYTSPMNGEDVSGATLVAFAELSNAAATPVTLAVEPVGGGSKLAVKGDPNSAAGATIEGLVAGTRYAATWTLTDANSDVITLPTRFVDQAGGATEGVEGKEGKEGKEGTEGKAGAPGKEGSVGKEGAAGREGSSGKEGSPGKEGAPGSQGLAGSPGSPGGPGPEGKQGPSGAAAEVVCTTKKVKIAVNHKPQTKTKTSCVVKQLAPGTTIAETSMMLTRDHVVYAVGHSAASSARVAMHDLRAVPPGEYELTLIVTRGRAKTRTHYMVRVGGGRG